MAAMQLERTPTASVTVPALHVAPPSVVLVNSAEDESKGSVPLELAPQTIFESTAASVNGTLFGVENPDDRVIHLY